MLWKPADSTGYSKRHITLELKGGVSNKSINDLVRKVIVDIKPVEGTCNTTIPVKCYPHGEYATKRTGGVVEMRLGQNYSISEKQTDRPFPSDYRCGPSGSTAPLKTQSIATEGSSFNVAGILVTIEQNITYGCIPHTVSRQTPSVQSGDWRF